MPLTALNRAAPVPVLVLSHAYATLLRQLYLTSLRNYGYCWLSHCVKSAQGYYIKTSLSLGLGREETKTHSLYLVHFWSSKYSPLFLTLIQMGHDVMNPLDIHQNISSALLQTREAAAVSVTTRLVRYWFFLLFPGRDLPFKKIMINALIVQIG